MEQLEKDPFSPAGETTSIEFCGGTHVKYAGKVHFSLSRLQNFKNNAI